MTADKTIKLLKTKIPQWKSDTIIIDEFTGKEIIKRFNGKIDKLSPMVMKGVIEKINPYGKSLLEPFVWSPAIMIGAISAGCQYEGITHHPDTYATMQSIGERLGPQINILYEVSPKNKYDIIILSVPEHYKYKKYLRYVRASFKLSRKLLKPDGTLIIKERYLLKGWPAEFNKLITLYRVGTRVKLITKNTMEKAMRITIFKGV